MEKDKTLGGLVTPLGENEIRVYGEVWVRKASLLYDKAIKELGGFCEEFSVTVKLPFPTPADDNEKNTNAYHIVKAIVSLGNNGELPNFFDENQRKNYPWFKKNASGSGLSCDDCVNWRTDADVPARLCSLDTDNVRKFVEKYPALYEILQIR